MAGSEALWFVSRGSGLALLAAFTIVVVLGAAARTGAAPRGWSRLALGELHRTLALFCVAFLVLHVVTAIADPYVTIGWAATVLPFASPYRTLAIGLGALSVDLGGAVLITSLVRQRLGYRAWRAVHWLAYLAWPAAFWHSVTAGTDLRIWWAAAVEWGCAAAAASACLARLLDRWRGPDRRGRTCTSQHRLGRGRRCDARCRACPARRRTSWHRPARRAATPAAARRRVRAGQSRRAPGPLRAAAVFTAGPP